MAWRRAMRAEGLEKVVDRLLADPCLAAGACPSLTVFAAAIASKWRRGRVASEIFLDVLRACAKDCLVTGRPAGPGPYSRLIGGNSIVRYLLNHRRPALPSPDDFDAIEAFILAFLDADQFDRRALSDKPGVVRGELPNVFLFVRRDRPRRATAARLRSHLGLDARPDEPHVVFPIRHRVRRNAHVPHALDAGTNPHFRCPPLRSRYGRTQDLGGASGVRECVTRPLRTSDFDDAPEYVGRG